MTNTETKTQLSIALPKGRLLKNSQKLFEKKGISFSFEDRKLVAYNKDKTLKFFLVKNCDLPTYVNHGIAGLGICGEDVIYESGLDFYKILEMPFGSTEMCMAAKKDNDTDSKEKKLTIATSFTKFTSDYFHSKGCPVEIIRLDGSVELAPILGLAPYIVDLVETGNTLKANNLEVIEKLTDIKVYLVANPAYYKIHYKAINDLIELLK